ncbi:relaxase/mobilization nuclease domain-containing protein [Sphingomonas sp. R86520]|uniref:relaxase/mobilization nuclease domain-containing protein n=1 Tax=Sphingomonas sp. R86520 TaxID=3093859 RepID=UPI0036D2AE9C
MLGIAVASMIPKPHTSNGRSRPTVQAKHAFGGSTDARMSGRAVMTLDRTSRRVPEVVVRITGRQHGGGHVLANFAYISRLGHGPEKELGLETSDGEVLRDGRDMQILAQDWHEWEMDGDARRKGATSISMILSMPTGTDPEKLKAAAVDFARQEFANRSWVAGLHVDRDHPHVHITIARRDLDGRRFHPDREDLFRWRQRFAEKLRDRGIEANATPTRARGLDPMHEHIAIQKMRDKGLVPRIDVSRADRAQRLRDQGVADPVMTVLATRHAMVRATYVRSITELSASPSFADQVVAQSLEKFVVSMPEPEANSARAIREARETRPVRNDLTPIEHLSTLDRLRALRDKATQPDATPATALTPAKSREPDRQLEVADRLQALIERANKLSELTASDEPPDATNERLRALIEKTSQPVAPIETERADEIVRQVQERDRAEQERDRARDRDGPGR